MVRDDARFRFVLGLIVVAVGLVLFFVNRDSIGVSMPLIALGSFYAGYGAGALEDR